MKIRIAAFATIMVAQMVLTQPGHTSLGAWSGPPYGAASVAATDFAKLSRSIAAQLAQAGLNVPRLNLFPAQASAADGWMAPGRPATITGLNSRSRFYLAIAGDLDGGVYGSQAPCMADAFQRQDARVDVVQVALHEVVHYVSYRLGLDRPAFVAASDHAAGVDPDNVRERIADAGSFLYMLSNYRDRAEIDREARARADVLRARVFDPDHDTSTSIAAAQERFNDAPSYGLSIVEAARWAADIVSRQPAADLAVSVGQAGGAGYRRAIESRNRFCGQA
jgi:hypothetical protein